LQYVVPSSTMYKPILKEVKLQWEEDNKTKPGLHALAIHQQIAGACKPVEHMYNLKSISVWCINWSGHARLLLAVTTIFFSHENAFIIEVCI